MGNRKSEPYAFVYGSFAHTAPLKRNLNSDIDVIASPDISQEKILELVKGTFPTLLSGLVDLQYRKQVDGKVVVVHYDYQHPKIIPLMPSSVPISFVPVRDFSGALRNPNKTDFHKFLRQQKRIHFNNVPLEGVKGNLTVKAHSYTKAIKEYGVDEYNSAIAGLPEERIYRSLRERDFVLNDRCKNKFKSFYIDTDRRIVCGVGSWPDYDKFLRKCLQ
jgi:hypothetical protein